MAQDKDTSTPEVAGLVASASQSLDASSPPAMVPGEDDGAVPDYRTDEEISAFWKGVAHGIRVGGGRQEDEGTPVRYRTDGWTPERQRAFLILLSTNGSVSEACRDIGLSRESAYRLRRKPEGRLFARLWEAALLLARERLADEAVERAMKGTEEAIVYRGEQVGSRTKLDNRHLQWTLTRLDRQHTDLDARAAPARRVVQAFDTLIEQLDSDAGEAAAMLAVIDETAARDSMALEAESEEELLARLEEAREIERVMRTDPADIDVSDLDPAERAAWSELDWARAERTGLFEAGPDNTGDGESRRGGTDPDDGFPPFDLSP